MFRAIVIGVTLGLASLVVADNVVSPEWDKPVVAPVVVKPVTGKPTSLSMGSVKMPVVNIKAQGGTLTPPDDPNTLGRWSGGSQVGSSGAMLLTGHAVHSGYAPLNDLENAQVGQQIIIETKNGKAVYTITKVDVRSKRWVASHAEKLFSQDGPHRLVLMTCEDYDLSTGDYSSNVIVQADLTPAR